MRLRIGLRASESKFTVVRVSSHEPPRRVSDLGVEGLGFRVGGLGFRVGGLGFRV